MKKIIVFFMTLVLIFTVAGCGKKPKAKIENEDIRRSSYKFELSVDENDNITKGSVLVNFYKLSKKDEVLVSTKTLTTFSETVSVTGLESDTEYRCDVLCTYNKKSHIIYSWVVKTKKNGTEFDPILIENANEFVDYLTKDYSEDAYYELANDIDFSEYSNKNEDGTEIPFEGISQTSSQAFAGTIKGNDKTIKNINITSSASYNGLFGYFKGTLEDVKFDNVNVNVKRDSSTTTYSGLVCGYAYQAKFINVEISNSTLTVDAKTQYTGGLVGYSFASNILNAKNNNLKLESKSGTTSYVGGLTSWIQQNSSDKYGKIIDATVSGTVNISATEKLYYGGLVGLLKSGATVEKAIANVNATINTTGATDAAGLIGNAKMSDFKVSDRIKNVVAKGKITYKSVKETDVVENSGDVAIAGLIASATAVKLSGAYSEMELDIEAKITSNKGLYSSLAFGRGFEYHTELSNAIVNGKINAVTIDSATDADISIHGYDGSVYNLSGDEKPLSTIDSETVSYVCVNINLDGSENVWPNPIKITDAKTLAKWDLIIWNVTVDETNNKIDVVFS